MVDGAAMIDEATTNGVLAPRELAAIFYRWRWWLLMLLLAGTLAASGIVLINKPVYRSSATLLIASQQISSTLVPVPLANYADERIAKIRQQIMSRGTLAGIISSMSLYPHARQKAPLDDIIGTMRRQIGVDLVGTNPGAGTAQAGSTIAFKLSFSYPDPLVARAVTARLTNLFLNADKRLRTEQASGTAAFLGRRANELRDQLVDMAGKRRAIEARYAGALPDQIALSAQSGASLRAEVSRIDAEQQGLMQQNGLLAARGQEIATAPPPGLDALRRAEEKLNQVSAVYADDFPDVVTAQGAVARERATLRRSPVPRSGGEIAAEVAAGRARIGMLASRRAGLVQSIGGMERMTLLAPQASYELNNLERDYDNLRLQYQDIREKQLEAQVAANLQTEDRGERFSVVDTPSLPLAPIGPGRINIIAMGALGGLLAGLVMLMIWEFASGSVHGENGVTFYMGAPPLVLVPVLKHGRGFSALATILRPFQWRRSS